MQVIKSGVEYLLNNSDGDKTSEGQKIRFIEKTDSGITPGITNEEVISMLKDRFRFLQVKKYSVENQLVLEHLDSISRLLMKRMTDKQKKVREYYELEEKNNDTGRQRKPSTSIPESDSRDFSINPG